MQANGRTDRRCRWHGDVRPGGRRWHGGRLGGRRRHGVRLGGTAGWHGGGGVVGLLLRLRFLHLLVLTLSLPLQQQCISLSMFHVLSNSRLDCGQLFGGQGFPILTAFSLDLGLNLTQSRSRAQDMILAQSQPISQPHHHQHHQSAGRVH